MSKDYKVGHCKPPEETQFQPGHSGNPNGRPKGSGHKSMRDVVQKVMNEKMEVSVQGKAKKMSQGEIMVRGLVKSAAQGNPAAFRALTGVLPEDDSIFGTPHSSDYKDPDEMREKIWKRLDDICQEEEMKTAEELYHSMAESIRKSEARSKL